MRFFALQTAQFGWLCVVICSGPVNHSRRKSGTNCGPHDSERLFPDRKSIERKVGQGSRARIESGSETSAVEMKSDLNTAEKK
jgi:hypothetical protein